MKTAASRMASTMPTVLMRVCLRADNMGMPSYSRDSVLTIQELAAALKVSVRTIERSDLPTVYLGSRTRRFVWGQILDVLASRAA